MIRAENILIIARGITKLYEQYVDELRSENKLSYLEIAIIVFLHNNPGQDTASDIAQTHLLQKGNVSQGVESLIKKSLIKRIPDTNDRRRIHLALTDHALPIIKEIENQRSKLLDTIFNGFTDEELDLYASFNERVHKNIISGLEGKL